jgi:hypothetical protein
MKDEDDSNDFLWVTAYIFVPVMLLLEAAFGKLDRGLFLFIGLPFFYLPVCSFFSFMAWRKSANWDPWFRISVVSVPMGMLLWSTCRFL